MALPIPLAPDNSEGKVLPTTDNDQCPFTCIKCAGSLVLVQGNTSQCCHFAHVSVNAGCSGGESLKTLAAQLIVARYITKITFMQTCGRRKHRLEKKYEGCTASLEFRYAGHCPGDVAVIEDGKLKAIIEIKGSRATTGGDLGDRASRVGPENLWEVDADKVINAQSSLHFAEGNVDFGATNHQNCQPCMLELRTSQQWKILKRAIARGDWDPPTSKADRNKQREALRYPYGKPSQGLCRNCSRKN